MRMVARVQNSQEENHVILTAGGQSHSLTIPPRPSGYGSSASGGELLLLALATCYCNDIYREADKKGIDVSHVDVECTADYLAEGAPASNVKYTARVRAKATEQQIRELVSLADQLAEIQNTVRASIPVTLAEVFIETA